MICLFGLPKAINAATFNVISRAQIFINIRSSSNQLPSSTVPITGVAYTNKAHLLSVRLNACAQLNYSHQKNSKNQNSEMLNNLPFFAAGEICMGFGRGSKELGIPTANFSLEIVKTLPPAIHTGIYYGWAKVENNEVYKMVMSIGWNPFYNNTERSMETHIMHDFNRDLYGCLLKVCIVGYLRPEKNFASLEELKDAINNDIEKANTLLDAEELQKFKKSKFFNDNNQAIQYNNKQNEEECNETFETNPRNGS